MKQKLAGLAVAGLLISPFAVSALSVTDIQVQLQALLARIAQLQLQLQIAQSASTSTTSTVSSDVATPRICTLLGRNLSQGSRGDDVTALQQFLQTDGYLSARATGYYGPLTAAAVAKWQSAAGVDAVGIFGPTSQAHMRVMRCGYPNPTPQCKPINYMPVLCSDGSAPQPTHDEAGCTTGYECPVANYTSPASCKVWNDGCNVCSKQSPTSEAMCTMRACFAAGKGYCMTYFDTTSGNKPPVVSGFSGPTTLIVGATGTWTINASDPEGGTLSYDIMWGDEQIARPALNAAGAAIDFVQTTTFTHAYASAGTYTVSIVVKDGAGEEAKTSTTVKVGSDTVCTTLYQPVCGQPPGPKCGPGMMCPMYMLAPQTYGNRCALDAAGATYLYDGMCTNSVGY